jgi:hypothetical protein
MSLSICSWNTSSFKRGGRRGHDRMVVGLTTTCAISAYLTIQVSSSNSVHYEVYSIQHCVIKFISYLRQVGGFLRH